MVLKILNNGTHGLIILWSIVLKFYVCKAIWFSRLRMLGPRSCFFFHLSNKKHLLERITRGKSQIAGEIILFVIKRLLRVGGLAANAFSYTCQCAKTMDETEFPGECSLVSR